MANSKETPAFNMVDVGASLKGGKGNEGLVVVLKDKLQTLVSTSSGYIESLPHKVKKRVEALQDLQRYDIVNGVVDVEDDKKEEEDSKNDDAEKGVPEFWLTAMKNNDVLAMQITERDEGALKFLEDIQCARLDSDKGEKGFKLGFFFNANSYFENSVLTKIYYMEDENEPILDRLVGTEIDWLPGKNLTRKVMKKKPKKGVKNAKPVTKIEQCPSFFNFFDPPKVPEDDDVDDDAAEELQDMMEQDYEIGSTIKDKLIPHAVSWFTGEAGDDDECISEDDDDADEDDDESEEEDEDHEGEENGHKSA